MEKMKAFVCGLSTLILVGCASPTVSDMKSPDGRSLKNVKCNIDPQKCYVLATESCKETNGSYSVLSSHSNAGGTVADIFPGPVTWYNMTIACGPSDGQMPKFEFRGQSYVQPAIVNQPRRSTTTNCTTFGGNVSCTTR